MSNGIVKGLTPEEKELKKKQAELAALEEKLANRELELTTLLASLRNFEIEYLRVVGVRFAKLDRIKADIAEAYTKLNPSDGKAAERNAQARHQAQESAEATSNIPRQSPKRKGADSVILKKLYCQVAKKIHPDLYIGTDEKERLRRDELMRKANRAFEEGDAALLQKILDGWETISEALKGEDIGARLVRVVREIAQIEERLIKINAEIQTIIHSDLYQLYLKANEAKSKKRDLLSEMAADLDIEITKAEKELAEMM